MSDYYTIKPLVSNIFQLYAIKYYNGMLNDKIQVTFYLNFNLHVLKFYASHEKKRRLNDFLFTSTSTKYCPPSTSSRLCQRFHMKIYNTNRGRLCCDHMVVLVDLPMKSVPITTQVVSSNPAHGIFFVTCNRVRIEDVFFGSNYSIH